MLQFYSLGQVSVQQLKSDVRWFMLEPSADCEGHQASAGHHDSPAVYVKDGCVSMQNYFHQGLNVNPFPSQTLGFVTKLSFMLWLVCGEQHLSFTGSQHFIIKSSICLPGQEIIATHPAGTDDGEVFRYPQVKTGGLVFLILIHHFWWFDVESTNKWHSGQHILGTALSVIIKMKVMSSKN